MCLIRPPPAAKLDRFTIMSILHDLKNELAFSWMAMWLVHLAVKN